MHVFQCVSMKKKTAVQAEVSMICHARRSNMSSISEVLFYYCVNGLWSDLIREQRRRAVSGDLLGPELAFLKVSLKAHPRVLSET